jgi:serine/threonine-protein kinase RsbW
MIGDPMATPERCNHLAVASDLDAMDTVLGWFEGIPHADVPSLLWLQGQMALVEGFTNAVRHAHADLDPPPDVQLSVSLSDGEFSLEVTDHGRPFDLASALAQLEAEAPGIEDDPLAREAHWGLFLMMKLRRDHGWTITYRRQEDDRNCLCLRHPFEAAGALDSGW